MARRLAAAVADPPPQISKASLAAVLFGANRWAECIVAVKNGTVVGYAIVSRYFEAHTGKRQLRIADLFVDEKTRGAGIGRAIFARLLERARDLSCDELAWEVWRANTPAYDFYGRLGAQHVDDVSTMRLALTSSAS